jgi:hypothetical protein
MVLLCRQSHQANSSMKANIPFIFLIAFCLNSFAQTDKKHFSPIEIKQKFLSTKYYYDSLYIESPYGLQIPLLQIRDETVTREFLVFKKSRNTAKFINLISAGFSLYAFFNSDKISGSTYWITIGSIGVVSGYFNIRSNIHLDKAVKRYNKVVSENKLGFHYDKIYNGQGFLSIGILHRF